MELSILRRDVEVIFARGSGELPGLGIVGGPFARALRKSLPDRRVGTYAVRYRAHWNQTTIGAGATDLVDRVVAMARRHPKLEFVLGGYSQGRWSCTSRWEGACGGPAVRGEYKTLPRSSRRASRRSPCRQSAGSVGREHARPLRPYHARLLQPGRSRLHVGAQRARAPYLRREREHPARGDVQRAADETCAVMRPLARPRIAALQRTFLV